MKINQVPILQEHLETAPPPTRGAWRSLWRSLGGSPGDNHCPAPWRRQAPGASLWATTWASPCPSWGRPWEIALGSLGEVLRCAWCLLAAPLGHSQTTDLQRPWRSYANRLGILGKFIGKSWRGFAGFLKFKPKPGGIHWRLSWGGAFGCVRFFGRALGDGPV